LANLSYNVACKATCLHTIG